MLRQVFYCMGMVWTACAAAATVDGILVWDAGVRIFPRIDGEVASVCCRPGDRIEAGDVLLKLDTRERELAIAEARAQVNAAKLNLEGAAVERDNAQDFFDRAVLAQEELNIAVRKFGIAEAQHAQAVARLELALLRGNWTTIYAPSAGWVTSRNVEVGEFVMPGYDREPVMIYQPEESWRVNAEIAKDQADRLVLGGQAVVVLRDKRFTGRITSFEAGDSPEKIRVVIGFANASRQLERWGQPVSVELP